MDAGVGGQIDGERWMGADGHRDGWMDEYMDRDGKMTVQTDGQISGSMGRNIGR